VLKTLKHLNSSISARAETYEYALLSSKLKRQAFIQELISRARMINHDFTAVLEQFRHGDVQGLVKVLAEGFEELSRLMIAAGDGAAAGKGEGGMDLDEIEKIVVVYQRQIKKPLGEMVRYVGKVLGRKEGWRDPV
jgi:hypothetical protein